MTSMAERLKASTAEDTLDTEDKKTALRLARYVLSTFVITGGTRTPSVKELDERFGIKTQHPRLQRRCGVFVTLEVGRRMPAQAKRLRGCIGYVSGTQSLAQGIAENAVNAASEDPRFPAVRRSELNGIAIEISAMTPLVPTTPEEVVVGVHGLEVRRGRACGLLLPQVATEQGWSREQFLMHTCLKAGIDPDAWRDRTRTQLFRFSAVVFNEDDFADELYAEADAQTTQ